MYANHFRTKVIIMLKKIFNKENYKKICDFFVKHAVLYCFILSLFVNLVVEMLSRQSVIRGIIHVFDSPAVFLYNSLLIFAVSLISLFFKRRAFALTLTVFPFLALGVINCAVLAYRVNPVSATDFVKIKSIFGIFNLYLEGWVFAIVVLAVILIIAGLILLFIHCARRERLVTVGVVSIPLTVVAISLFLSVCIQNGFISKKFTNLNDAYEDYGFVYCFSCSVFETGIARPSDYSEEKVVTILDEIKAEETLSPAEKPNVLFLQLESFFDVNHVTSLSYSENPIPFFTSLKNNFPHGYLKVPYIGSGTANVEFEILTGMSLEFFGPGEYPYKTVLQNTACESVAFNLRELGYKAHAIHNHKGSFYDRAHVFSSLGFDTFTPLEFMQDVSYNAIGWANDSVLTNEIVSALDSTEEQDLIYAITVQAHGVYSEEKIDGVDYIFEVEALDPATAVDETAFEYYLTQLRADDDFLKDLLAVLSQRDEKTVVVMYGDHLPYFGLENSEVDNGDVYQTEYVIWSNYGLEAEARDLYSYELTSHILGELGMNNGLITKLHQNGASSEDYYKYLEMLQYDMLYGEKECYGYDIGYTPTELQMGVKPLEVTSVSNTYLGLEVKGEAFTEFTRVTVNGEKQETQFIDNNTLLVPDVEILYGDVITVKQTNGKRTTFAESEPVIAGEDI